MTSGSRFANALRIYRRVAVFAALVAVPLVAFPFRADERFALYADSARFGANPFRVAAGAIDEIGFFIGRGNFRPLGRMIDYSEHSLALEVAVSTGVALPVVHGLFRLLAIALIGVAGLLSLRVLSRSIGAGRPYAFQVMRSSEILYPLVFGVCVVAAGAGSPFTLFPFLYLTSTAIPILASVIVCRSSNLIEGRLAWYAVPGYLVLGAVLASTFDLVYLAIPLLTVLALVQLWLSPFSIRSIWKLRLGKAVAVTYAGFVAVFVPTRLLIQDACAGGACYAASDLSFDTAGVAVFFDRMLSGMPVAGWAFVRDSVGFGGVRWTTFVGNAGATLVAVGLVAAAIVIGRSLARSSQPGSAGPRASRSDASSLILAALWPIAIVAGASLIAALSAKMQADRPAIGFGWRDSGFAAIGWALLISLCAAAVLELLRSMPWRSVVAWALAFVFLCGSAITYLANANLAESASRDPESIINNRIAAEVVDFDRTELGNERRCDLLADFSAVFHDRQYERDVQLTGVVNWISKKRYRVPFCDLDALPSG